MVTESGASVLITKQYFGATTVAASKTVKNSHFLLKLAFASIFCFFDCRRRNEEGTDEF